MKHWPRIIIAASLLTIAATFPPLRAAEKADPRPRAEAPKATPASVPAVKDAPPVPALEVMSAAGRKPHPASKPGEVMEMTCKELGNFEFDQEKGGKIPADVMRLSGATVRLWGYMIPMDQADNITQFALVPKLEGGGYLHPPLVQHTIICDCPKGKCVGYYPDELIVEGKLTVEVKKDEGYIASIFGLAVTSVKPAPK